MLRPIEKTFSNHEYPDLLVGLGQPDDAAVWKIDDNRALVVTTDFFTPVVDDAYQYGAIAAANSLSDVYAMGGKPFLALNIAAIPVDLPAEITSDIFLGGAEKAREAGVVIAGGHTVQDKEPKYGLIAIGFVDPTKMMTKTGARPGDILLLSKPLGFGTTATAIKQDKAKIKDIDEAVSWMMMLNRDAADLAVRHGVRCATDVTGYSLLGHAWEIASASGVGMQFQRDKIPFISGARDYAAEFIFPGGAYDNLSFFQSNMIFVNDIEEQEKLLLFDPQTSGGLLMTVPPQEAGAMLQNAQKKGISLWEIGEVVQGNKILVD